MKRVALPISILLIFSFLLTACGAVAPQATPTPTQNPDAPVFNIILHSFYFKPDRIRLQVGQKVTFHISNTDIVDHEIMIGRNPLRNGQGELGDGFEHDFFALTKPKVTGDAQVMGMEGGDMAGMAMGTGMPESSMNMDATATPEGGMAMGTQTSDGEMGGMTGMENGFMAMLNPDKEATITFTVTPEMVGTWTMGCFEVTNNHSHFDEGMAGILYVVPASE